MEHLCLESPDQPEVLALIQALDDYQDQLYPPESRHALDLAALMQPEVLFAVGRDDAGRAVACGAVVLGHDDSCGDGEVHGEVKRLYVAPSQRGRGLALRLMAHLEDQARQRGCRLLRLETGPYQPEAIALYERCGFVHCGRFGHYRDDPLSVFMEKPLPA